MRNRPTASSLKMLREGDRPPSSIRPRAFPISDYPLWFCIVMGASLIPIWGDAVRLRFHGTQSYLAIVALLALAFLYRRFRADHNNALAISIETAAAFIGFTVVSAPMTYLCARTSHNLFDLSLRQADHALGFDWDIWNHFIQSMALPNLVLNLSYDSLIVQAFIALFFLPSVGDGRRGFELVRHALLSIGITCLLFWMFPAMGAAKAGWTSDVELLRGSSFLDMDIRGLTGIISFPSFHAVLAVLFTYACRGTRLLPPAIVLNALMATSALSAGKHYLVDVIAGLCVAFVSIVGIQWLVGVGVELRAAIGRAAVAGFTPKTVGRQSVKIGGPTAQFPYLSGTPQAQVLEGSPTVLD